ncbi:MAG: metallophosphoesterase family protein [Acidobacteria bacterium]|nr:metallophosphoesterase family protein [Acidobacteriota bacterium]
MRLAVLSDIHSNIAALEAVVEAIDRLSPDEIVCLGDIVGYNAQPGECIRLIQNITPMVIAGNHDRDIVSGMAIQGTNKSAYLVQNWTRLHLQEDELNYLASLPGHLVQPEYVAVHGCYLNTTYVNGYVTSTMLEENLQAVCERPTWPRLALCGHTHVPMCGWLEGTGCIEPRFPQSVRWPGSARVVLINPGSVGQPRDLDPRASFALVDTELRTLEIHRVVYDVERTIEAIKQAHLPIELAERLRIGR